jgi:hypothetical protein
MSAFRVPTVTRIRSPASKTILSGSHRRPGEVFAALIIKKPHDIELRGDFWSVLETAKYVPCAQRQWQDDEWRRPDKSRLSILFRAEIPVWLYQAPLP